MHCYCLWHQSIIWSVVVNCTWVAMSSCGGLLLSQTEAVWLCQLGESKIRFFNRIDIEKEGRTFHYREQYLSHEPELISGTSDLHFPLVEKFLLLIHRKIYPKPNNLPGIKILSIIIITGVISYHRKWVKFLVRCTNEQREQNTDRISKGVVRYLLTAVHIWFQFAVGTWVISVSNSHFGLRFGSSGINFSIDWWPE